eukprot:15371908-Alexandrium_andersonii.AAC.1
MGGTRGLLLDLDAPPIPRAPAERPGEAPERARQGCLREAWNGAARGHNDAHRPRADGGARPGPPTKR